MPWSQQRLKLRRLRQLYKKAPGAASLQWCFAISWIPRRCQASSIPRTCVESSAPMQLSCQTFAANAARLQLHALAYNLGNFLRTLATPEPIKDWSLTSLKEKMINIGAKVVSHGRYVAFQMAEVAK
jgi:Transposase DDE domain group 1